MEKIKEYRNTIFPVDTLKKAIVLFDSLAKTERVIGIAKYIDPNKKNLTDEEIFSREITRNFSIKQFDETWNYDSEDEFFGDYRKYDPSNCQNCVFRRKSPLDSDSLRHLIPI